MNVYIVYNIVYKNPECLYFRGGGRIDKNIINNIGNTYYTTTNKVLETYLRKQRYVYIIPINSYV